MARSGIETEYNGALYRSRLEARWAAMFDLLGIPFTYEPFDFNGYIPDFILNGESPVLVEVRPCVTRQEYMAVAAEMEQRVGFIDPHHRSCHFVKRENGDLEPQSPWGHDLLILGVNALPHLDNHHGDAAGLLGEIQGYGCHCVKCEGQSWLSNSKPFAWGSPWWWLPAAWMQCEKPTRHIGFVHEEGSFANRPCGEYFGGHHLPADASEIANLWSQAHQKTRWERATTQRVQPNWEKPQRPGGWKPWGTQS